jgi:hypothetical protein
MYSACFDVRTKLVFPKCDASTCSFGTPQSVLQFKAHIGTQISSKTCASLAHKPRDRVIKLQPLSLHQFRLGLLHSSGASKGAWRVTDARAEDKQQQPHALPPLLLLLLLPARTFDTERAGIAVTLMARVLQAPNSNLGRDTGYSDWLLHDVPQSLRENFGTVSRLHHSSFLPNPSEFITHLWSYYSTLMGKIAYIVGNFQFLIYYEEMFSVFSLCERSSEWTDILGIRYCSV